MDLKDVDNDYKRLLLVLKFSKISMILNIKDLLLDMIIRETFIIFYIKIKIQKTSILMK